MKVRMGELSKAEVKEYRIAQARQECCSSLLEFVKKQKPLKKSAVLAHLSKLTTINEANMAATVAFARAHGPIGKRDYSSESFKASFEAADIARSEVLDKASNTAQAG